MNKENCSAIEDFRNAMAWLGQGYLGAFNSKKNYQLCWGKACWAVLNGFLVCSRMENLWLTEVVSTFKYPTSESKGAHYRSTFYSCPSPFPSFSFIKVSESLLSNPSYMAGYLGASFTICVSERVRAQLVLILTHLSINLPNRYAYHQSFAGIQFDVAYCSDSIPHPVIWG